MGTEYRIRVADDTMSITESRTEDARTAEIEFRQVRSRYPNRVVELQMRSVEPWMTVETTGPPEMVSRLRS
jgi:hypothetical protein